LENEQAGRSTGYWRDARRLRADFSDPGQPIQRDGGQRFKLIADSLGARKCLG
jgi:hypothetical protein